MDFSQFTDGSPATRHNGWSPELKIKFLDHLAAKGSVRAACSFAGMSHEAAYRLRRRDALFARGWNAALALAREASADVLGCRAVDGIAEDIWYRGEVVGTRIRHDTRLLLAHLARLDRLVEESPASADAGRFDELLAALGGAAIDEDIPCGEDGLPFDRQAAMEYAAKEARRECIDDAGSAYEAEGAPALGEDAEFDREQRDIFAQMCAEAEEDARLGTAARWDAWFARACGQVDAVLEGGEFSPRTLSTMSAVSTSGDANPPRNGEDYDSDCIDADRLGQGVQAR